MRQIYSENEPIEKHPPRSVGDPIVIINKITGMPNIGVLSEYGILIKENDCLWLASLHYWEIAWP